MRLTVQKRVICWLISVLTVLLILITLTRLVTRDLTHTQQEYTRGIVGLFSQILEDARSTSDSLNAMGYTSCSDANLLAMQRALYLSKYIKDIGFYRDDALVCTTGLGHLDVPFQEEPPDYVAPSNDIYWYSAKLLIFDGKRSGFVARRGRYNTVIDLESLHRQANTSHYQWEILYTYNQISNRVAGNSGIANRLLPSGFWDKLLSSYVTECGSPSPFYCLTTYKSALSQIRDNILTYLLIITISLIAGGATHSVLRRIFEHRLTVEYRVKQGLKNGAYYWLYQPIVDLKTQRVVGCEALARFEDEYGPLYPDIFIPAIKACGLQWSFTRKMFQVSLNDLTAADELPDKFYVSFNIFPISLVGPKIRKLASLPEVIASRFDIMLEIVEDERLESKETLDNLDFLRQHGFKIAIDDFGTGYSNLGELKKINSDVLKIDRSFVTDMEVQSIRSSLIPYIVDIANQVGVSVVAEGIENQLQRDALLRLGVPLGQGWAFGKPMSVEQLVEVSRHSSTGERHTVAEDRYTL